MLPFSDLVFSFPVLSDGETTMTTIQSADYTAFKQFATFQSIEELNHAVRRFLYTHSHELKPSVIQTIKTISRFSCKIFWVCWTKIDTLASAVGISRSSVERAIRTLKQYGILTVQKTDRDTISMLFLHMTYRVTEGK